MLGLLGPPGRWAPETAPDLPAVAAARQHEAVLPVVQVEALLREGLTPLPAEDAEAVGKREAEVAVIPEDLSAYPLLSA